MRRLPLQFAALQSFFRRLRDRLRVSRRRQFAKQLAPITFRQLEPRRVLSVTSAMDAAGVLSVTITNGEAVGLYTNGANLFVDTDGDATQDAGEFTDALIDFKSLQVTDTNGGASFFWGSIFTATNASSIQASTVNLVGTLTVSSLTLDVDGTATVSGNVSVTGDLAVTDTQGTLTNTDNAHLDVTGHAQLNSKSITLGQKANDVIDFGSVSFSNADTVATIDEDSSTLLTGAQSVKQLTLHSAGSIELQDGAALGASAGLQLDANGVDADVTINGTITGGAGNVTLTADDDISMDANASITTTTGNVLLTANADAADGNDFDDISMSSGAKIVVGDARIELSTLGASGGSIGLGHLESTSNLADAIEINSQQAIIDSTTDDPTNAANDPNLNISAVNGTAVLKALQAIGNGNDIDIDVASVIFDTGAAINLTDTRGGLTISGPSQAAGGGSITANSPLTISANVTVGASTVFTAGNSNLAGDTLTIDSGALVQLNTGAAGTLTFNAGDDIVFNNGRIETVGNVLHEVILAADLDNAGVGSSDGDRGAISQPTDAVKEVTSGKLTASAADGIDLDTKVDTLVASNSATGAIKIANTGDLNIQSASTTDGAITITSTGTLTATSVNAAGAAADVVLSGSTGVVAVSVTGNQNVSITAAAGDVTSGAVTATTGNLVVQASNGNITVGDMRAGAQAQLIAAAAINSVADDGIADIRAGTIIQLNAGTGISGPLATDRLEVLASSQVAAASTIGNILLEGLGALTLNNVITGNGAIDVLAAGLLTAVVVDSTNTDNNNNDITLTSSGGSVVLGSVLAGPNNGDVTISAAVNILDGDTSPDNLDVQGNDVTLTATTGSIGSTTANIFIGVASPIEIQANGNLIANAVAGSLALDATVTGTSTLNSPTAWVQSNGNLDVSAQVFAFQNLALIADADGDGVGTLTIAPTLSVVGDLRVEGADVQAAGPIDLTANRLMFVSGRSGILPLQDETITIHARQFDGTTSGNLTVTSVLPVGQTLELIDVNEDNMALRTLSNTGSIDLQANSTIIISDDVIAGNDSLTTSSGTVTLRAQGATSDLFINDVVLTDAGNIVLRADNDIRFGTAPSGNEPTTNDDLSIVTTIDGSVTLVADANGDANGAGGEFFMANTTRVIAGRDATTNYVPGTAGNASPSTIALGSVAKAVGANIVVSADENVTIAFLQSANNTTAAIDVTSVSAGILDGSDVAAVANLIANNNGARANLRAVTGIGSTNAIETNLFAVDARNLDGAVAASGSIRITETVLGGALNVAAVNQANLGDVLVQTGNGNLTVDGVGITNEQGNVLVQTTGANRDIILNSAITSSSGNVSAVSGDDVLVNANITTAANSVYLLAANGNTSGVGTDGIIMADNTRVQNFAGNIRLQADNEGDIVLGALDTVDANPAAGTVVLRAGGSILSGANDLNELNVDAGSLYAVADSNSNNLGSIGQADILNGTPALNAQAINTRVQTLAAVSATGVYIEEADSLTIDAVTPTATTRVNTDGSTTPVNDLSLSDIRTLTDGPVKIVLTSGSLTLNPGTNANGLAIESVNDVLLETRDIAGDIVITAGAGIVSSAGNVHVQAADDMFVNASITGASGVRVVALNGTADAFNGIQVNATISSTGGDVLLDSGADVDLAVAQSTSGGLAIFAGRDILQNVNLQSLTSIALNAGRDYLMINGTSTIANQAIVAIAGDQIDLAFHQALQVALSAGGNISDINGATNNVRANSLSLVSGAGIGAADPLNAPNNNDNAIDIQLGRMIAGEDGLLAASAVGGIYLQDSTIAGAIVVNTIAALTVTNTTQTVNFNSTRTASPRTNTQAQIEDLRSTNGPIKLVMLDGSLTIERGTANATAIDTGGGDLLLEARGAGHDITIGNGAGVITGAGHLNLRAVDNVTIQGALQTTTGSVYVTGTSLDLSGSIVTGSGDVVLQGSQAVTVQGSGNITSTTGDVRLASSTAGVTVNGIVSTGGGVLVSAATSVSMTTGAITGSTIIVSTSTDMTLGSLSAIDVHLLSGGNILDGNGAATNVQSSSLSMQAVGSIGTSDLLNAPNLNANAIDIQVNTLAAQAGTGIYLEDTAIGGTLTIDRVAAGAISFSVQQVNFNSTRTSLDSGALDIAREDLISTTGPVKLVADARTINVTGGAADTIGVRTFGGDILLDARGPASDLLLQPGVSIDSGAGHITLAAGDQINLQGPVSTTTGTINVVAGGDLLVNSTIQSINGDIRLSAGNDLVLANTVNTTSGDLALLAGRDVLQQVNISLAGGVTINAGNDLAMSLGTSTVAGPAIVAIAGNDLLLTSLQALQVGLQSGRNIVDINGPTVTIRANDLSINAGGLVGNSDVLNAPNQNANALDVQLGNLFGAVPGRLAAQGVNGMYIEELSVGGQLFVTSIGQILVDVQIQQVNFNSTQTTIDVSGLKAASEDLRSTNGPVKLVVTDGSLTIQRGTVDDVGVSTTSGNILLDARGAGHDLLIETNAIVQSTTSGNINLVAEDLLTVRGTVSSSAGTVLATARNIDLFGAITSGSGDILVSPTQTATIDGSINSTTGNVGVVAATINQDGTISTGGNILLRATNDLTMTTAASSLAGGTLIATGNNLILGLLQGNLVSLEAVQNIVDGNDTRVPAVSILPNVRASQLRMVAGGAIGAADGITANPDQNLNAIDLEVGTVAAVSSSGIYLQELTAGGNLIIGNALAASVTVNAQRVDFRSTTTLVTETSSLTTLDDLQTTNNGPIKLIVEAGSLTVTEGNDNDNIGVYAHGTGDVLLRTYGPTSDIISTDDGGPNGEARILSDIGNITLRAADDISLTAQVFTGGSGTIYMRADNTTSDGPLDGVDINRVVATASGDILVQTAGNISIDATISTALSDVGLIAGVDLRQQANISGVNVLVDAGRDIVMASTTQTVATDFALLNAGRDIALGLVQAGPRVGLHAGGNILDNNGSLANVSATSLRMDAGGSIGTSDLGNPDPDANAQAIDLVVSTVAASAGTGIYLENSGNLTIGHVDPVSVTVTSTEVQFRSTTAPVVESRTQNALDDLETINGPIKVIVNTGTLTVTEGSDDDGVGVRAGGDILLRAYGAGNDLITTDDLGPNGRAAIVSVAGNIVLQAIDEINLNSQVTTGLTGTIYMVSGGIMDINQQVTTASGDILLRSGASLTVDGAIQSTSGDIGLIAASPVAQNASISTTSGNVFIDAAGNFTNSTTSITAGAGILINSGGTITLGLLQAADVSLQATNNILDGNDILPLTRNVNVRAGSLRMVAGGTIGQADGVTADPEVNLNAIDLEVGTVAAQAGTGIYLQELLAGGALTIGHVATLTIQIDVQLPEFRSTTLPVTETRTLTELSDLETTANGPIKVVVDNGTLTVNEGNDNDNVGVSANGSGDVLLRVYGAGSDIITTDDLGVNGEARILSGTGNITLRAVDEISLTARVTTGGAGTIYAVSGGNTDINRQMTTASGDVLLRSSAGISIDGPIQSTSGDIGLIASGQVQQTANITTTGNVFVDAVGNVTSSAATIASGTILINSGATITLGLLQANTVSLQATGDILDGNDVRLPLTLNTNVRATGLRMVAGGTIGRPDVVTTNTEVNLEAIDLEVGTVAAQSASGIYLQELVGNLTIGNVVATSVTVSVQDVEFRSTTSPISETRSLGTLNDLTTTNGPIKVVVDQGTLTVTEGLDNNNVGVSAGGNGDILLRVYGPGSDIIVTDDLGPSGEARIDSGTGNITLRATDEIRLTAQLSTAGSGNIYMVSGGLLDINRQVSSATGTILLRSGADISIDANIQSTSGDIGLIATGQVLQTAGVSTSGNLLVDAGGNVSLIITTIVGGSLEINSGGTITLGLLQATNVSLNAAQDILDGNDVSLPLTRNTNVRASSLRMVAGGTIGRADILNTDPEANLNAIDLEVGTVAARSATGIYLEELAAGTNLIIGNVGASGLTINVREVEFRSTTGLISETRSSGELNDLETTNNGPIKVVVDAGTLTINEGTDNDGVGVHAHGTGNVLLRVYGAGNDIIATDDLGPNGAAGITSDTGNITLRAIDEIRLDAPVGTGGNGTIYMVSGGLQDLNRLISTADGDILLRAGSDLAIDGGIQSTGGNIGLISGGQVLQTTNITTVGGSVFIDAIDNVVSSTATTSANQSIVINSGGTITLGLLQAANVSLNAAQDILDGNDVRVTSSLNTNVRATQLRMIAGGTIGQADAISAIPDFNLNAIDLEVGTVAAQSATGIYLQELSAGGDLVIGNVAANSVTVNVRDVEFRSTTSLITETRALDELNDLETTNNGSIKVVVDAGRLRVTEGNDNDNIGVAANGTGNVLLRASGAGSDIVVTDDLGVSGEARILSGIGNIALQAADQVSLTAQVATGGSGTVYIVSVGSMDINRQVTSVNGDILLRSSAGISLDGNIQSTSGDIGLIAAGQILQSANILTTTGNAFIDATGNVTMTLPTTQTVAGGNILIDSRGTITLGLLQAARVSLNATNDILDGNDTRAVPDAASIVRANVRASELRMVAGGRIGTADAVTALPEQNLNAIDTEVGTVAAQSAAGIYLQELAAGGDLVIGNVPLTSITVDVQNVEFRSTSSLVTETRSLNQLNDLETTNNGPIKVIVEAGTLTVTEGNDNDNVGVRANGTGDVLLRVYGAGSDIITTDDLAAGGEARILSGTGNLTLRAADEINLTAQVATGGAGTIYMVSGGNIDINRQVTTVDGDMLLRAGADMFIDGNLQSTSGDIGLIAAGQVLQSADILTTGGNVFIDATGSVTMTQTATQTVAGGNILIDSRGTITLGLLQAVRVSLNATNDILDGNDTRGVPDAASIIRANVRASGLRMIAGGTIGTADVVTALVEQNLNAIDLEVGTVAAQSATGIYLQELAAGGDLVIGNVPATSVTVNVRDVEFRSTTSLVTETRSLNQLDDLETTNNGSIKVIVEAGTLTVTEGNEDDNVGVRANGTGNVLLRAYGAGSDVIATDDLGVGGEARILSGTGHITLRAADEISLTAQVATGGAGTIYMVSGSNTDINRQVTTANGDILLRSDADISIDGNLQSTSGDIGLIAAGQVLQSADILTTTGNAFIDATGNVTMTLPATQTVAGGNILIDSRGTITLGLLQAVRVSLNATNDILDGNDTRAVPDAASTIRANVRASQLRMIAGGTIGTADAVTALVEQNLSAIDTEVGTVAAQSATGIYLQELAAGGDLIIGNVPLTSITVDVQDVEFRSTTSPITETRSLGQLNDLVTTNNGSIKVIVEAGTLTVTEGNDDDNVGVSANGTGNVLLRVYGAGSDIIVTDDLGASGEARILSGTGHITLRAADEISLTAQVATSGAGTIYMVSGGNMDINRQVTTANGDILLRSAADIFIDGNLQSTSGDIGLIAAGQVLQSADILTTSGDVFIDATGNVTMTQPLTQTVAGGNILIDSRGTITLGLLQAARVSLNATNDILDGNDTRAVPDAASIIRANVRASQLRMVAGGTIGTADGVTALPEQNLSAIDMEVGAVAAQSATGIYLQELVAGGGLNIGNVLTTSVTVNVFDVEFRSTTSLVDPGTRTLGELNDLEATNNGPIKVIVEAGTLTVTEGNDNDNVGVRANGTGDVLLRVYGAGSDIITTDDLGAGGEARILSGTGNLTLRAADDISLTAQVATGGAGTIYMVSGGNTDINRQVTTVDGDMLLRAGADMFIDGNLQSTSGDIGLIAAGQVLQSADILTTGGNVFIDATGNVTMTQTATQTVAGGNILIDSRGTITLGLLQAVRVSLNATNDILDGNDTRGVPDAASIIRANVRASGLRMIAGGTIGTADVVTALVEQNLNAIDLEVGTVAAQSATGIYLQELAAGGDLVIGNVPATSVTVNVRDVEFRSTTSLITETRSLNQLDDLETTNNGSIKVIVEAGTLTVTEGNDDDNVGVRANGTGNVLLRAYGAGSDVIATDDLGAGGEARILSGTGHITLRAADEISLTAQVATGGAGTIYMVSGGNTDINRQVTSVNGDILLRSGADISIDGNLQSTSGDIGLIAAGQVLQSADILTTTGNAFIDATGNVTMTLPATQTVAGGNILIDSRGTITLGLLQAVRVSLNATNDILDGNDTRAVPDAASTIRANVRASQLRMIAGGTIGTADAVTALVEQNLSAIDTEVGTVAAQSATGIYLQELAAGGDLVIGNVPLTSITVDVQDVEFRSTTSPITETRSLGQLNDLVTTNNGSIKVIVEGRHTDSH